MDYREELDEGTVFLEPAELDKAIIGTAISNGHYVVAYSYTSLVRTYMQMEGWEWEEAAEWVDYNTIRALPYMGALSPVIVYVEEKE